MYIFVGHQALAFEMGATHEEQILGMPGDDIVPDPDFNATRGIYIQLTGRIQDW